MNSSVVSKLEAYIDNLLVQQLMKSSSCPVIFIVLAIFYSEMIKLGLPSHFVSAILYSKMINSIISLKDYLLE